MYASLTMAEAMNSIQASAKVTTKDAGLVDALKALGWNQEQVRQHPPACLLMRSVGVLRVFMHHT